MATYVESPIADTASRVALALEKGSPHPLGASPGPGGVDFSLFSANAAEVELLLFAAHDAPGPFQVIRLDPFVNKSFHFWHVFVRELKPGTHYSYRVDGLSTTLSPTTKSTKPTARATGTTSTKPELELRCRGRVK
jgi:pullulanase/glycogen debranching enzyme